MPAAAGGDGTAVVVVVGDNRRRHHQIWSLTGGGVAPGAGDTAGKSFGCSSAVRQRWRLCACVILFVV